MKPTATQLQEHNVSLIHGPGRAGAIEMTYFFHGRDYYCAAQRQRSAGRLLGSGVGVIREHRNSLHRCKSLLDPNALVTCYAGRIEGIDLLRRSSCAST